MSESLRRREPRRSAAPRPVRTLLGLLVLVVALVGTLAAGNLAGSASPVPRLALDLEGGTQVILTPRTTDGSAIDDEDVVQAIEIIRNRVDGSGVAEAEISSQGGQNIVVGIPGRASEETLELISRSAQLRFRPVLALQGPTTIDPSQLLPEESATEGPESGSDGAESPSAAESGSESPSESASAGAGTERALEAAQNAPTDGPGAAEIPDEVRGAAFIAADANGDGELSTEPDTEPADTSDQAWITERVMYDIYALDCTLPANQSGGWADDSESAVVACDSSGQQKFVLGPAVVEGTQLTGASSGMQTNSQGMSTGLWAVNLELNSEATEVFAEVSQRLPTLPTPQDQFAIVLDGVVISNAGFTSPILDGSAQITGDFTDEEANALANQLNFGSLPITFEVQSTEQISATLGSEQLTNAALAGLIGLVLVVAYMIWQYRGLGLLSVASLAVAAVIVYVVIALLSWTINYRLSLPGVAGLIISIGTTADSFIVYFERIRDEIRDGRTLASAVEHGWKRARRTIIASDAVNFLAAIVLYLLAVGGVRGFAFTLGLTTIIDLLVVVLFTHPMMQVLVRMPFFRDGHRLSGLSPERLGVDPALYRGAGRFRSRTSGRDRPGTSGTDEPDDDGPTASGRDRETVGAAAGTTIAERRAAERRAEREKRKKERSVDPYAGLGGSGDDGAVV
ncbi:protein translocase subunit SecD [Georgenia sp. Z1344]|uniref:protein translocase subunit SecD n=1 Tax=Georgenia sp. Z1344 TaxID=3416706 RepID=UPI003CF2E4E7